MQINSGAQLHDVHEHPQPLGADNEVGSLRTVLLHRPGAELGRLTPSNNSSLLFDGLPWVARAQEEHDRFAEVLRDRGVEVVYLAELLEQVFDNIEARALATAPVISQRRLGHALRTVLVSHLEGLDPVKLVDTLVAGLASDELPPSLSLVHKLMSPADFIIDPLPNLLFTRDSSFWLRNHVGISSFAMRARQREASLLQAIYRYHPRFSATTQLYQPQLELLEGGDVVLLGKGVIAIGVGERSTAAGAERLAARVLRAKLCHTVLAVPIPVSRATMHLDTLATMVDRETLVTNGHTMQGLIAYPVRLNQSTDDGDAQIQIGEVAPLLQAAAQALKIDALRVIDTGGDRIVAEREQWDDGNNTLCLTPGTVVAYERNTKTIRKLETVGIEVIAIRGSELGSGRGGPRCMSCPIQRDA
ncbi:MAG: arginine deiminase [Acidimicrobiales bacterium]|nr:MAG: arginine deiminase [Acidimicrobiales bacterium]